MHALGLLPLVRTLWIRGYDDFFVFSPKRLNILPQFRALNNVQQLTIVYLDTPSFVPKIRRCFGHFMSAVQYPTLNGPRGSRRQIIYFIGMFQHLETLRLLYDGVRFWGEPVDDLTLVPSFTPPLQGFLRLTCFTKVGLLGGQEPIPCFGERW